MDDEEFVGCVSCLNTSDLHDLYIGYSEKTDTYGKMLQNCFNIKVSEDLKYICTTCVQKLEDAMAFKEQTLKNMAILMSVKDEEYLDETLLDEESVSGNSRLQKVIIITKRDGNEITNVDETIALEAGILVCEACGQGAETRMDLRDHLRQCHSIVTENVGRSDRFKCHFCDNAYNSRKACYTHLRMKHGLKLTNDTTPQHEPRERKQCHLCDKDFSQTQILKKHLWKEHGCEVERRKAHLCPLCDARVSYGTHFSEHLLIDHQVRERVQHLVFNNMEEFMVHKNKIQERTKCRFRKTTATKRTIEGLRSHYMCSQSGVYVCQGRGLRPAPERQIYKTGKACPAHMVVTQARDAIRVTFHSTHVGHDECPFYQPKKAKKPKSQRSDDSSEVYTKIEILEVEEYMCEGCGRSFDDEAEFERHMASHEDAVACHEEDDTGPCETAPREEFGRHKTGTEEDFGRHRTGTKDFERLQTIEEEDDMGCVETSPKRDSKHVKTSPKGDLKRLNVIYEEDDDVERLNNSPEGDLKRLNIISEDDDLKSLNKSPKKRLKTVLEEADDIKNLKTILRGDFKCLKKSREDTYIECIKTSLKTDIKRYMTEHEDENDVEGVKTDAEGELKRLKTSPKAVYKRHTTRHK